MIGETEKMLVHYLTGAHLDMAVSVVVQVDDSDELTVGCDGQVLCRFDALTQCLAGVFLHLDVEKLSVEAVRAGRQSRMLRQTTGRQRQHTGIVETHIVMLWEPLPF